MSEDGPLPGWGALLGEPEPTPGPPPGRPPPEATTEVAPPPRVARPVETPLRLALPDAPSAPTAPAPAAPPIDFDVAALAALEPAREDRSGGPVRPGPAPRTDRAEDPEERRAWIGLAAVVGGTALILGAWFLLRSPEVPEPPPAPALVGGPTPRAPAPTGPTPPSGEAARPPRPTAVKAAGTAEAAESPAETAPILSVISVPAGAEVTVGGEVIGRTPLVQKSPWRGAPVRMRVALEGFAPWEGLAAPNEAGHYAVTAVLMRRSR